MTDRGGRANAGAGTRPPTSGLVFLRGGEQVFREEREGVADEALLGAVGVAAGKLGERVGDAAGGEFFVEGADGDGDVAKVVARADVEADGAEAADIGEVGVEHRERHGGMPAGVHGWIRDEAAVAGDEGVVDGERLCGGIGREGGGADIEEAGVIFARAGGGYVTLEIGVGRDAGDGDHGGVFRAELGGETDEGGRERIDGAEDIGVEKTKTEGAEAAHGETSDAAAGGLGERAVTGVDPRDEIADECVFPAARDRGIHVERANVGVGAVGVDDDQFGRERAGAERGGDGGAERRMAGAGAFPIGGFHAEAVEEVDDGETARGLGGVGGRQVDEDGLVGGVAEGILFEGGGVEGVTLEGGLAGRRGGGDGLGAERGEGGEKKEREKLERAVEHGETVKTAGSTSWLSGVQWWPETARATIKMHEIERCGHEVEQTS